MLSALRGLWREGGAAGIKDSKALIGLPDRRGGPSATTACSHRNAKNGQPFIVDVVLHAEIRVKPGARTT